MNLPSFSLKKLITGTILCLFMSFFLFDFSSTDTEVVVEIPGELESLIQAKHSLPKYAEAYYSPLGRSPVIDALLGDPFYMPTYANLVTDSIDRASESNRLYDVYLTILLASGMPVNPAHSFAPSPTKILPEPFLNAFGKAASETMYNLWRTFIAISEDVEQTLAPLSPEEKQWIIENHEAFFFGISPKENQYDFFTTDSPMPLKFFDLASRIDIAKLAECCLGLCRIVDQVNQQRTVFESIQIPYFKWEEEGRTLIVSGKSNETHREDADFFLDLGHNNTILNNAGGTQGKRPAAVHIALHGNHTYMGEKFVQGSGLLGIGILANFGGDNTYKAKSYSQGAAFFGAGILMDLGGNGSYEIDFFGQSAAAFGTSLLWDKYGNETYIAHEGMAQAASSTLGIAFLVDNAGNDLYSAGGSTASLARDSGIGQGGSIGVRGSPWIGHPSFYGGVSFLFDKEGNDSYWTPWFGQGSAYFLGLGILVDGDGNDQFKASVDAQGQGLHLAAGLLLKKGGKGYFSGGWGSMGVAADRSVGMLIDMGGDDIYEGLGHSIGSARKPKALGVFIDVQGNDRYSFKDSSNGNIQKPESPDEWPTALFLDLNGIDAYPENVDDLHRCNNCRWEIDGHGLGIDVDLPADQLNEALFKKFPQAPRIDFPFDPQNTWSGNTAYRPLEHPTNLQEATALMQKIPAMEYDARRHTYEALDLWRFTHPFDRLDVSELLKHPSQASEDQFNWAILWATQDRLMTPLQPIMQALRQATIKSAYARKMAIRYVARLGGLQAPLILAEEAANDSDEENRCEAVAYLARIQTEESFRLLKPFFQSPSECIRYRAAAGLQDSPLPDALNAVIPLLNDQSFYVRRAASMTAISLHYKPAIPILLETLAIPTLDTTDNYGDNIYKTLASYVGVDYGLDRTAWQAWWNQVKDTFAFPERGN